MHTPSPRVPTLHHTHLPPHTHTQNNGTVIMGSNFPTVYQQVIDKTKDLTIRSYQLAANIERHSANGLL